MIQMFIYILNELSINFNGLQKSRKITWRMDSFKAWWVMFYWRQICKGWPLKLLSVFLPSSQSFIQRAAAEGLGLLESLGVSEDAHTRTIESSIVHSVGELL